MDLDMLKVKQAVYILYIILCLVTKTSSQKCEKVDEVSIKCDHIPTVIDAGITKVYIQNVTSEGKAMVIRQSNFSAVNWEKVEYLELNDQENSASFTVHFKFENECFANLVSLRELRIHLKSLYIYPEIFVGLDSVETVDLGNCPRLKYSQLVQAFNGTHRLPRLDKLILSKWSSFSGRNALNDSFVDVLPRNITFIDVSSSQISTLNFTAFSKKLKHLEGLNISYSVISEIFSKHITQTDLKNFKIIDLSYATLPSSSIPILPGRTEFKNVHIKVSRLHPRTRLIFSPLTLNGSGLISAFSSIYIENSTFTIDDDLQTLTQNIILQNNQLKRLDVNVICDKHNMSSFRLVDFSANGMEYLHPTILYCMPNIVTVDLSKNNLYIMAKEHPSLFEVFFSELPKLKFISLAENLLREIPMDLFSKSRMVETIDLSRNRLQQVTFKLSDLNHLQTLDLSQNNIQSLDSLSLSRLDSIQCTNASTKVVFTANPILCSKCMSKKFLKWLVSSNLVNISSQNLQCMNKDHHLELINESTLKRVEKLCYIKTVTLAGSISAGVVFILTGVLIGIIYGRKRRAQRIQNRVNVINNLCDGAGQHEFVAYLAYSSDDHDFVMKYVLQQLNENLQLMTGIDRELICTGDKHLRFGFDIRSETIRCLDRSAVVIVVVSESFCTSEYCHHELDQAYIKRKPIVLMFKERVEESVMMPTMKELYRNKVRMLWNFENGEYVLKSTWENVSTSVLDLVPCDV